jgi:hypothetical protein
LPSKVDSTVAVEGFVPSTSEAADNSIRFISIEGIQVANNTEEFIAIGRIRHCFIGKVDPFA